MDKTTKLKSMIFDQYRSVREFAEAADLPYTTVHSILKRGIENSSVDNVMKMCRILGITIEELLKDDSYYLNLESAKIAQEAFENSELRILFDAARNVSPEDLKYVIDLVKRLEKEENPDPEDFPDEVYDDDFNQDPGDD